MTAMNSSLYRAGIHPIICVCVCVCGGGEEEDNVRSHTLCIEDTSLIGTHLQAPTPLKPSYIAASDSH